MKLTFLGTGTSTGVPQVGCHCSVCTSPDARDKRLRTSALLHTDNGNNLLIDCGPDFRQQMLNADSPDLTAAIFTHTHYDHVGGVDDMRPYCATGRFNVYCRPDVAEDLRNRVPYCFRKNLYPGVPTFNLHDVDDNTPFYVGDDLVTPLPVMHFKMPILGYRIDNLAYITDCKTMPQSTLALMQGVDVLVINALRIEPHMSHLNLAEAIEIINKVQPREAYLTHISHHMGRHADVDPQLPPHVHLAYDGLTITI
jgi:phosphoribosyl 1,2-cyclic phosphate phosphodiesterase